MNSRSPVSRIPYYTMPKPRLIGKRTLPARRPIAVQNPRARNTPRVRVNVGRTKPRSARSNTWEKHAHDLVDQAGGLYRSARNTASTLWALGSKITGHGDYRINKNSLLTDSAPPTFGSQGGGIRIRHREYVRDVVSAGSAFTLTRHDLNPGDPHLFPFLSTIAKNFEQYRLNGLIFEYRPTGGFSVGTPNASMGTVNIATNYDVLDAPFSSKMAMDAYEFSSSDVPFQKIIHPIECARSSTPLSELYIAPLGTVPPTGDPRFYYFGSTYIATSGQQTAQTLGELWVSYDITFLKPKISSIPDVLPVVGYTMPITGGVAPRFFVGQYNTNNTVTSSLNSTYNQLSVDLPPGVYSILEWWGLAGAVTPGVLPSDLTLVNASFISSRSTTFTPSAATPFFRETVFSVASGALPVLFSDAVSYSARGQYILTIVPRGSLISTPGPLLPDFSLDESEEKGHPVTPSHDFVQLPAVISKSI